MREPKDYLIIYHKEDNDGVFSAAIFYDYITRVLGKNLTDLCFMGMDYNDMSKFMKENTVEQLHTDFNHIIMTDISFNDPKYMKALYKEFGNEFVWCDHHKPIIQESFKHKFDDVNGIRDTGRSAILCAYKYLYDVFDEKYNDKKIPLLLRILSAWDSWTYEKEGFEFDYVKSINTAVTTKYNLELGTIKKLVTDLILTYETDKPTGQFSGLYKDESLINELHAYGTTLVDYDKKKMDNIIATSSDCSWRLCIEDEDKDRPLFRETCAIFHQGPTNSTMFASLKKTNPIVRHGLIFKHNSDSSWTVSLYNIYDDDWFDCGQFLKENYKGGGHKGAAGCQLTEAQFIKILKNKIL